MSAVVEGIQILIKALFPVVATSLLAYLISYGLEESFGFDIMSATSYVVVLIISFVPLFIVLFKPGLFDSIYFVKFNNEVANYIANLIPGVILHRVWDKILRN